MRRIAAATAVLLVAGGVTALAAPASAKPGPGPARAAAAALATGTYVPLPAQVRVVDTRTGAYGNPKGAVAGGHAITATIGGRAGVPTDASSVQVTLHAMSPTAAGGLVGYVGTRPATTNLQFGIGASVSDTATLPLSAGKVTLYNSAAGGSVQIVADVSGYYTAGTPSTTAPGIYHSIPKAARVVNTVTGGGYHNHKGALGPNAGIVPSLDHAGVPAGAGSVAVTITVTHATKAGSIVAYRPDEQRRDYPVVHFGAGQPVSAFAVVRVSGGDVHLINDSGGTVDLLVDVTGYYTFGYTQTANAFQTVRQYRTPTRSVGAGATGVVSLSGVGGIPRAQAAGALVTLAVLAPAGSGYLQAYRTGAARPPSAAALLFHPGPTVSNILTVPLSGAGQVTLYNSSGRAVSVVVDVDGYVPGNSVPTASRSAVARYPNGLNGTSAHDIAALKADGMADGSAGARFVLLDIGAQSITAPGLSATHPGVVLTQQSKRTPITYPNLVTDLRGYLQGFNAASPGATATLALGTNNDGQFTGTNGYGPAKRGRDWALQLVNVLAAYTATDAPGVTVQAAVDFESDAFTGNLTQAQQWEQYYFAATDNGLVFNGSADGCPMDYGTTGQACNFGWTQKAYYGLAHHLRSNGTDQTVVLPQVYNTNQAIQWAQIDATGGGALHFLGSLTEYAIDPAGLVPLEGSASLYRALSSVVASPSVPYAVDIDNDVATAAGNPAGSAAGLPR